MHWLPVTHTIQYKLCLLVYKSLLGHTPEYISDLLTSVTNIPTSSCRVHVDELVTWAFSVAAPRAWNRLPTELKLLRSTDLFRRDLKTFFSFCLWAPGYGLTLWCALGLLVGGAIQVPQLRLQHVSNVPLICHRLPGVTPIPNNTAWCQKDKGIM